MSSPRLVSVQVGRPRQFGTPGAADPHDRPWVTGFFKEPVAGPVAVGPAGLDGDGQADLVNHGGPEKAVLAYSADHYPPWRTELLRPDLSFGAFGENLTVAGQAEADVCIGDLWRVGPVLLSVTQPRQPCWKLARRWRLTKLPARVVETGRSGWYFRVLEAGAVEAGAAVELAERPNPEWTVARASGVMYDRRADRDTVAALAAASGLSASWRADLQARLDGR